MTMELSVMVTTDPCATRSTRAGFAGVDCWANEATGTVVAKAIVINPDTNRVDLRTPADTPHHSGSASAQSRPRREVRPKACAVRVQNLKEFAVQTADDRLREVNEFLRKLGKDAPLYRGTPGEAVVRTLGQEQNGIRHRLIDATSGPDSQASFFMVSRDAYKVLIYAHAPEEHSEATWKDWQLTFDTLAIDTTP
jgi:hypothetical protein